MNSEYRSSLQDSLFVLEHVLDWQRLFALPRYAHADTETASAVLREGARFTEQVLGPINGPGDVQGSHLVDGRVVTPDAFKPAWREYVNNGWPTLDLPESVGGQGLPLCVQVAFAEMVNGACLSFAMLPLMLRAASWLLLEHADEKLAGTVVPRLTSGEWGATICISEAQAGSDVGRIATRAVPQEDGSYRLTGTKIFITYGDQDLTDQILHLVLARTPDAAAGTRGLSLFLVPKLDLNDNTPNTVSVTRVEHKMGLKASPTCVLQLEEATGHRIGTEGRGLNHMFTMVNLMRLEVSMQGPALAAAATHKTMRYARERPQGGDPEHKPRMLVEHADIRRMLLLMTSRTRAMRALILQAAQYLDLARAAPTEEEREEAAMLAGYLLPVCKACGSETGFEVCNLAIQVHGGHGYVADAGVEQYVRDVRVAAIYEGSNGIQALDLVTRKLLRDGGAQYRLLVQQIEEALHAAEGNARLQKIHDAVITGLAVLQRITDFLLNEHTADARRVEAVATDYLQLTGKVACGWMWLRMAAACNDAGDNKNYRVCADFYAEHVMPEINVHADRVLAGSDTIDAYNYND